MGGSVGAAIKPCPHCGHPMPRDFLPYVKLTRMQKRILEIVSRASPNGISTEELAGMVYANDPNGGPAWAYSCIKTTVCRLNKILKPHGLRVYGKLGRHSDGYRLVNTTKSGWEEMWSRPFDWPEILHG